MRLISFTWIVAALAVIVAAPAWSQNTDFATWLEGVRAEARQNGISESTMDAAFAGVAPIPRVIELDRSQPESTLTFAQYMDRVIPESRVREGREKLAANRAELKVAEKRFGVQSRFIVALWGIETNFGKHTGGFSVIAALSTLAYDGRRSKYFRKELMAALQILEEGHIAADAMKGSWAGAMGQSQFMPTSFTRFAVDANGDGRRDIWTTKADVFGSAANYLARSGWQGNRTWGRRVTLPAGFDRSLASLKIQKTLAEWQSLGVRRADGSDLPKVAGMKGSVIFPGDENAPPHLVYENFRTILKWNRSNYFATAVGTLADRIAGY